MSDRISVSDALSLPLEDRLRLVEEIWDSIAACPDVVLLTEAQGRELDSRLEAHRRNPSEVRPGQRSRND
jgi:putative addiction module component (TIGR02574 family)